jgi:hypothetical protein
VGAIQEALARADPAVVARAVAGEAPVRVDGWELAPEDVLVSSVDRQGYASAQEAGYAAVVATELTSELADEGLAREVVHRLQTMRRSAGFDIADRIVTYYRGGDALRRVMERFADYVRQETLSLAWWSERPRRPSRDPHRRRAGGGAGFSGGLPRHYGWASPRSSEPRTSTTFASGPAWGVPPLVHHPLLVARPRSTTSA